MSKADMSDQHAAREYAKEAVGGTGSPARHERAFLSGCAFKEAHMKKEIEDYRMALTAIARNTCSLRHHILAADFLKWSKK